MLSASLKGLLDCAMPSVDRLSTGRGEGGTVRGEDGTERRGESGTVGKREEAGVDCMEEAGLESFE